MTSFKHRVTLFNHPFHYLYFVELFTNAKNPGYLFRKNLSDIPKGLKDKQLSILVTERIKFATGVVI